MAEQTAKKKNMPLLRFKGFDETWEEKQLGELADIVGGGTPSTAISENWNGDIDWYAPAEINDQIFLKESQRKITEYGYKHSSAKMLPVGTVLFTSRAGIGKTAILKKEGCTNQGFQSIVPNKNELDSYFIFSRTDELKKYGETIGAGSTFVEVSGKQMAQMNLLMPEKLFEQQQIGAFFQKFDTLITQQKQKHEKLKNIKKGLLEKMFPKAGSNKPEIRFKGFDEAWEEKRLGDLSISITKGTTPLNKVTNGSINFIKIENIEDFSGEITLNHRITEEEHNNYLRRSRLQENDILFSIAGTLGRIASIPLEILPANTNQALAIIRLKSGNIQYIKTFLKGRAVSEYIKKNPTIGAQPNLSLQQVSNIKINFGSSLEQTQIGTFFQKLDTLITLQQRKIEKLQNLKKACLEKMFV